MRINVHQIVDSDTTIASMTYLPCALPLASHFQLEVINACQVGSCCQGFVKCVTCAPLCAVLPSSLLSQACHLACDVAWPPDCSSDPACPACCESATNKRLPLPAAFQHSQFRTGSGSTARVDHSLLRSGWAAVAAYGRRATAYMPREFEPDIKPRFGGLQQYWSQVPVLCQWD